MIIRTAAVAAPERAGWLATEAQTAARPVRFSFLRNNPLAGIAEAVAAAAPETGFDYSAATEDGRAILAAAVPEPAGFAFLAQEIEPDDYRGRTVTFRGELRTAEADGRAGLVLRAASPGRSTPPQAASPDPREDPACVTIADCGRRAGSAQLLAAHRHARLPRSLPPRWGVR